MIQRFEVALRRLRRGLSRSHWTARALGLPAAPAGAGACGLLMVQIDGLSRGRLQRALREGRMPFLRRLLWREGHELHRLYPGVPSTTPVVQGELFYGVRGMVPGFAFVERESGQIIRMYEHDPARAVEQELAGEPALLEGGSAYCNVYTGGAADARFCMASLGFGDFFRAARPLAIPLLAVVHLPALVRTAGLVAWELARAAIGFVRGVAQGQDLRSELAFVSMRVAICVVLREMVTLGAKVDLARGLPAVHANLLGYDEHAHRRGPSSEEALAALGELDRSIASLARAASRSERRRYALWVYSDHGQEETRPYPEVHGRSVQDAVAAVFAARGIQAAEAGSQPAESGVQGQRARLLGDALLRLIVPGTDVKSRWRQPGQLTVTAQGPLGHVYSPRPLAPHERDAIAEGLIREAGIPLVLAAAAPGAALAWSAEGRFELPRQAARVLGEEHPYREAVADDLVALCHHRNAGELLISGFAPGPRSLSFPHENGAHAGPGPQETDAFALLPDDTPLPRELGADGFLRPLDLRGAGFAVLRGEARLPSRSGRARRGGRLRVMTYNVHSCVGMDGRTSPKRIARVIARHDPDVVALQELDVGRSRTGGADQAREIARELEMQLHFHPTITVAEERFGDAILSRHPLRLVRAGPLPRLPGRPGLEPRGAIWVAVEVGGTSFQVFNTHLSLHHRERGLQVAALLGPEWLDHPDCQGVRVLCGDLNALPFFPVCRRIARVLRDGQVGRSGHRPRGTFFPRAPLGRIDHVFVDPEVEVTRVEVPSSELSRVASDHLPLLVELAVPGRPVSSRPDPVAPRPSCP